MKWRQIILMWLCVIVTLGRMASAGIDQQNDDAVKEVNSGLQSMPIIVLGTYSMDKAKAESANSENSPESEPKRSQEENPKRSNWFDPDG